MKKFLLLSALLLTLGTTAAFADTYVRGHTRQDGTYVPPHVRSSPDANRYNNHNSQTNGGSQRDENSAGTGATNKSNSTYRMRDNDGDGVPNNFDRSPNSGQSSW